MYYLQTSSSSQTASPQFQTIYPVVVSSSAGHISASPTYSYAASSLKTGSTVPPGSATSYASIASAPSTTHASNASALPIAPQFTGPWKDQYGVSFYVEVSSQNKFYKDSYGDYSYYDAHAKRLYIYDHISKTIRYI